MCLAIPAKVIQLLENDNVIVDVGGTQKTISTALVADVKVGDYVIMHVGYALSRMDEQRAKETLTLIEQMSAEAEV